MSETMVTRPGLRAAVRTHLRLGRVSNLPTVWTNVLAAAALAGAPLDAATLAPPLAAMTAFYIGGMYLNDAFDHPIDARERPERPIPAGEIRAGTVFAIGFALIAAGVAAMAAGGLAAAVAGLALAAAIIAYDVRHKGNVLSPVVMGACRALVYVGTAAFAAALTGPVVAAAAGLLAYIAGVTYAARQESLDRIGSLWPLALLAAPALVAVALLLRAGTAGPAAIVALAAVAATVAVAVRRLVRRDRPGAVPRAVGLMLAGISLVDALYAATAGLPAVAALAALGFLATLALHRVVPGT